MVKMKDLRFVKCQEYSPLSRKCNALGMKTFWRADTPWGHSIAYGDTKAECMAEARWFLKRNNTDDLK